jgi:hypothetical protein
MNENNGSRRPMISAAISLIVLCLLGVATVMGWWPPRKPGTVYTFSASKNDMDAAMRNGMANCGDCGVIESIRVETVLGGLSGSGAIIGDAYSKENLEKSIKQHTKYRVMVRMVGGTHKKLYVDAPNYAVGQKVKVVNDHIESYSNS